MIIVIEIGSGNGACARRLIVVATAVVRARHAAAKNFVRGAFKVQRSALWIFDNDERAVISLSISFRRLRASKLLFKCRQVGPGYCRTLFGCIAHLSRDISCAETHFGRGCNLLFTLSNPAVLALGSSCVAQSTMARVVTKIPAIFLLSVEESI